MTKKETEMKELLEEFNMLEEHGFSDVFHSEYDQTKEYNESEFIVLERVSLERCWICGSPMWTVKCKGEIFEAFPTEIIEGLW